MFIPLVIIMFRKKDGGIRVCSRKTVLNRNVFLTTPIYRNLADSFFHQFTVFKKMVHRPYFALILLLFISSISGCTFHITPTEIPMKPGMVMQRYESLDPIAITNNQPNTDNVVIVKGKMVFANLNQWTELAIEILKTEFLDNNIYVSYDSNKKLFLSIINAQVTQEFGVMRANLELNVVAGGDFKKTYRITNTGLDIWRACGGGITRAVATMLNDDMILSYIEGKESQPQKKRAVDKLKQLNEMRDNKLITQEEFDEKKKEILDEF